MFDWEKFWVSSITEPSRSQWNDPRSIAGSITERSIDYGGRMKFQLNSEITPGIQKRSRQFHFLLVVKKHRKPLHLPAY